MRICLNSLSRIAFALICLPVAFWQGTSAVVGAESIDTRVGDQGLRCSLQSIEGSLRCKELVNRATGFNWAKPVSATGSVLVQDASLTLGFENSSGFELAKTNGRAEELTTTWSRTDGLEIDWSVRSLERRNVLEFDATFRNTGKSTIEKAKGIGSLVLPLRNDAGPLRLHWLSRKTYRMQHAELTNSFTLDGGGWNAPEAVGWLAIENPREQEVLFVGIQWESSWRISLVKQNDAWILTTVLALPGVELKPDQTLQAPRVFLGTSHGDLDDSLRELHDYLRQAVFPSPLPEFPWVAYNIWGTDSAGVESLIAAEIPVAKELGVELFYVDASWYEGSAKDGSGDWFSGVGNWNVEDRTKYPSGLAAMSKRVHDAGMKFGLWFAPQVVDSRLVHKSIPRSWIATRDGNDLSLNLGNGWAPITQICLGNPDVVKHLKESMAGAVSKYDLDWLKWDNSGLPGGVCNCKDHGHQAVDGAQAALRGEYEIYEYLHKRFPKLVLENCGYPSRLDYGLARYARAHWLSDDTAHALQCRQSQIHGSYAFPAIHNAAWVVRSEEINAQDAVVLDTVVRSRMIGLFGMGTLSGKLIERASLYSPEMKEALKRNIISYKKFRHLLHEDVYHLLPPSTGAGQWDAIEFCKRDGSEAVVIAFRSSAPSDTQFVKLRGLEPDQTYSRISLNAGIVEKLKGESLLTEGMSVSISGSDGSEIYLLKTDTP